MLKRKGLIIVPLFLLMALTVIIIPWHSGYIYSGSDMRFHINRIVEMLHSVGKGFPLVNFYTFNSVGYDINSFYPLLLLYLFSPIYFLIKNPVNSFYAFLLVLLFLTQLCTYIAGRSIKLQRKNAVLLALFYTFSGYIIFVYLFAFELGEAMAFIAFPIVLVAVISYISPSLTSRRFNQFRDIIFVLSLTWITYSHLLSTLLCLMLVIITLLFFVIKDRDFKKLGKYIWLGFCYFLTTSFFWLNFLNSYLHQKILGPEKYLSVISAQQVLTNSLENKLTTGNVDPFDSVSIGLILLIAALILITNYGKLNNLPKVLVILAAIFFILSTDLFCWSFLEKHFYNIETIQFTFRLLIIVILMLSFAICLYCKPSLKFVALMAICVAVFNVNAGNNFVNQGRTQETLKSVPTIKHQPRYASFKINAGDFHYLYHGFYGEQGGPADYLTRRQKQSFNSIETQQLLANGQDINKHFTVSTNNIRYKFRLLKNSKVDLPILKTPYQYRVIDNGRQINYLTSSRGTLEISHIAAGSHVVSVRVYAPPIFYISIVLTILGFLINCLMAWWEF